MMEPDYKQVTLEKMKLIAYAELGDHFAEPAEMRTSEHVSFVADNLAITLVQKIWGKQKEIFSLSYPADWWQSFKGRWFPPWALGRWPVRFKTHTVIARELYPKVSFPQWEHVVQFDEIATVDRGIND